MKKGMILLGVLLALVACDSSRNVDKPVVYSISPEAAQVKSPILITGDHFIDTYSRTYVRFNDEKADGEDFNSVTSTEINLLVPNMGTTGPLNIKISDETSNSLPFTVFGPWAYVVYPQGIIVPVDTYNNNLRPSAALDFTPDQLEFAPEGDKVYLINYEVPMVVVLSGPTNTPLTTIPLPGNPVDIAVSVQEQHRAFVTLGATGTVATIDTYYDTLEFIIGAGSDPGPVVVDQYDKEAKRAYIVNRGDRNIMAFEIASLELKGTSAVLGGTPDQLYISPDSSDLATINPDTNTVSLVHADDNVGFRADVPVGTAPAKGAFTTNSNDFYVTNSGDNTVSVVSVSNKNVGDVVQVGMSPYGIAVQPNNEYMYVANTGDNTVSIIRTSNKSVTSLPTGIAPTDVGAVAGPEDNNELDRIFILNIGSGTVTVILTDTREVETTVDLGLAGPIFMKVETLDTYPPDEQDIRLPLKY